MHAAWRRIACGRLPRLNCLSLLLLKLLLALLHLLQHLLRRLDGLLISGIGRLLGVGGIGIVSSSVCAIVSLGSLSGIGVRLHRSHCRLPPWRAGLRLAVGGDGRSIGARFGH